MTRTAPDLAPPSPNFHSTSTGRRLSFETDLTCSNPFTHWVMSGTRLEFMARQSRGIKLIWSKGAIKPKSFSDELRRNSAMSTELQAACRRVLSSVREEKTNSVRSGDRGSCRIEAPHPIQWTEYAISSK
ncbi:hypothetical protein TNCV_1372041 [Trichonephila clavipes]|nr:hypothetical protein TNCV_1372041 [Trichonephila clavipes]